MHVENYANLLKSIFKIKNSIVFYTDNAKKSKTIDATMMRYFNTGTKAKN